MRIGVVGASNIEMSKQRDSLNVTVMLCIASHGGIVPGGQKCLHSS